MLLTQHLAGRGRWISESKATLVYRVRYRTARAPQRNCLEKQKQNRNRAVRVPTVLGHLFSQFELEMKYYLSERDCDCSWVEELRLCSVSQAPTQG